MNRKQLIMMLVIYTPIMFLAGQFFINPQKPVGYNIAFALSCAALYALFMWGFYGYMRRKKKAQGK